MMRFRKGGGGGLSVSNGRSKETKELMRVADVTTTDPCAHDDDDDDDEAAYGRSSNRGNRGSCRAFCNSRLINGKVTASLVKTYAVAWT